MPTYDIETELIASSQHIVEFQATSIDNYTFSRHEYDQMKIVAKRQVVATDPDTAFRDFGIKLERLVYAISFQTSSALHWSFNNVLIKRTDLSLCILRYFDRSPNTNMSLYFVNDVLDVEKLAKSAENNERLRGFLRFFNFAANTDGNESSVAHLLHLLQAAEAYAGEVPGVRGLTYDQKRLENFIGADIRKFFFVDKVRLKGTRKKKSIRNAISHGYMPDIDQTEHIETLVRNMQRNIKSRYRLSSYRLIEVDPVRGFYRWDGYNRLVVAGDVSEFTLAGIEKVQNMLSQLQESGLRLLYGSEASGAVRLMSH